MAAYRCLKLHPDLTYNGPIFDTHTHIVDIDALDMLVQIGQEYGVERSILICHSLEAKNLAERRYPGRFLFAKYIPGALRFTKGVDTIVKEIKILKKQGYDIAKMQSAPIMRARAGVERDALHLDTEVMDPMFQALEEEDVPFLLHLSDPDTYYESRYTDTTTFNGKKRDLLELEGVISRHSKTRFQLAHFAAQPEPNRLDNLGRWFDTYSNIHIDTGSARWMVRELGKNPPKAREFLKKYADKVHFGTDCVAFGADQEYYSARYFSLRLLFESDVKKVPLPFTDSDTINSGGTFINGLHLSHDILKKLYWENALSFYNQ